MPRKLLSEAPRERLRQCIGCREMKPKSELIRIAKSPDGVISPDFTGKMPGRGAYICKNEKCRERAEKSKALSRAFKMATPSDIWKQLGDSENIWIKP